MLLCKGNAMHKSRQAKSEIGFLIAEAEIGFVIAEAKELSRLLDERRITQLKRHSCVLSRD